MSFSILLLFGPSSSSTNAGGRVLYFFPGLFRCNKMDAVFVSFYHPPSPMTISTGCCCKCMTKPTASHLTFLHPIPSIDDSECPRVRAGPHSATMHNVRLSNHHRTPVTPRAHIVHHPRARLSLPPRDLGVVDGQQAVHGRGARRHRGHRGHRGQRRRRAPGFGEPRSALAQHHLVVANQVEIESSSSYFSLKH